MCLRSIALPNGLTSLSYNAFAGCVSVESISIPGSLTVIPNDVFTNFKCLNKLTIGYGVEEIGNYAFRYCYNLKAISIPGSVKKIGQYAFSDCYNVKSITLGYGIEDIGYEAFWNCDKVETLVIPSSVTQMGDYAFESLDKIKKICLTEELYNQYYTSKVFSRTNPDTWFILRENPGKISGKTAKVKKKKVKKKAQTISASKLYKISPKTGVNAVKLSGNKNFTVNQRNGSITVKKGTKKGTYKIKVSVMSTGNATYKASAWKTVTVKIKVK